MSIGIWQVLLILVIVLIIFGSGKLPRVMEDLARGFRSFRNGLNDQDSAGEPKQIPREEIAEQTPKKRTHNKVS